MITSEMVRIISVIWWGIVFGGSAFGIAWYIGRELESTHQVQYEMFREFSVRLEEIRCRLQELEILTNVKPNSFGEFLLSRGENTPTENGTRLDRR